MNCWRRFLEIVHEQFRSVSGAQGINLSAVGCKFSPEHSCSCRPTPFAFLSPITIQESVSPQFGGNRFMSQDLRSYIDLIRERKLLLDIKKEVDPLTNLAGIAYRGENEQGKGTMF